MKSAVSLTLAACVVALAAPAAAQDRRASTAGPIASAVTREAGRLTAEDQTETADIDWSRVRALAPGADVDVTRKSSLSGKRYFLAADGSSLTVLNVTDPALPVEVARHLRELALRRPEYLTGGTSAVVDKGIEVGPAGVFVGDRKVVDLGQVVERIVRSDVAEIRIPLRTRGSLGWAAAGAAVGFALGYRSFLGTIDCPYAGTCGAWRLRKTAPLWLPVAGGFLGYHKSHHNVGGLIYRAASVS